MAENVWWRDVKGILLDITGVLYEPGENGGSVVQGSLNAVKRLKEAGIPVRFCTNETSCTKKQFVNQLKSYGFDIELSKIFSPIPAVCAILKKRNLRPFLFVSPNALDDFEGIDTNDPNCIVVGDCNHDFSYKNMNKAFQLLKSLPNPILFSLGRGKYYQDNGKLLLDVGPYMKALEYACDITAEVVGKPSTDFFQAALNDLNVPANKVVMIGDDIVNDIGGAQAVGMKGVLVSTGKYRPEDKYHSTVKADGYSTNLSEAVDLILSNY